MLRGPNRSQGIRRVVHQNKFCFVIDQLLNLVKISLPFVLSLKMIKSGLESHTLSNCQSKRETWRWEKIVISWIRQQIHNRPQSHAPSSSQIHIIFRQSMINTFKCLDHCLSGFVFALRICISIDFPNTVGQKLKVFFMSPEYLNLYLYSEDMVGSPMERLMFSLGLSGYSSRGIEGNTLQMKFLSGFLRLRKALFPCGFLFHCFGSACIYSYFFNLKILDINQQSTTHQQCHHSNEVDDIKSIDRLIFIKQRAKLFQMIKKANSLADSGHYEEAIKIYKEYIETKPSEKSVIAAYENMAVVYDFNRQYDKAAECCDKVIELDPNHKNGEIYFSQGQYYQMAKMYSEAKMAYLIYIEKHPHHAECSFNLGVAYEVTGQLEKACEWFQKAYISKPDYIKAYKQKISILKKFNRYDEIIKLCKESLKIDPMDFELTYEEGFALSKINNFKQSFISLRETIQKNKRFVKAYITIAQVCSKMQEIKGLDYVETCLKQNKDIMRQIEQRELIFWKGALLMNERKYGEAEACYKAILKNKPIIEAAKGRLATCLEEQGKIFFMNKNFREALNCFKQGLNYDQSRVSLLNNTGLAYQNLHNLVQAEKMHRDVLNLDSKNNSALNNLAALQHLKGNVKEAKKMFEKLTSLDFQTYQGHVNNGKRFFQHCQFHQALKQFEIAEKMEKEHGHDFYNDMAVILEKLGLFQKAFYYIEKADKLTQSRSPLILMNKVSILMNLKRVEEAKKSMDWARHAIKTNDRSYLSTLGITSKNFNFIFKQLDHYSYLINPIDVFMQGLAKQIVKCTEEEKKLQIFKKVEETVKKAETYAINQVLINKEAKEAQPNPEQARQNLTVVKNYVKIASQQFEQLKLEIKALRHQLEMQKRNSRELREIIEKNIPKSHHLREKLQDLSCKNDLILWNYGKQLYWILNGYLSGYMLISTGIVQKGENIDRSTFNTAISKVGGAAQFMQFVPLIGDFTELISNVSGLLVDMEDEAIIKKMYEMISFNYDTEEQMKDAICQTVMLFLDNPEKIKKIREKVIFNPPHKEFFERWKQRFEDIKSWFEEKKNQFVIHMRGYEKAENIIESELAIIDVGVIVSIMLNMQSDSTCKRPVITNAAKRALADCELQEMVCQAYERQNENLMKSNNSFCLVMKCQLIFDNPLLNSSDFYYYLKSIRKPHSSKLLLEKTEEEKKIIQKFLSARQFHKILNYQL